MEMKFENLFYATRRIKPAFNKYRETCVLLDEIRNNSLSIEYKIKEINNRKYVVLDNKSKILDSFLLNELIKQYEVKLSQSLYSFRQNKGVVSAIKNSYPLFLSNKYFLKTDIKDFFGSISLSSLFICIKDFEYLPLLKKLLGSIKGIRGLPLGLMISGYLSNIFIYQLDFRYDKYIRYADDIVVFSNDKRELLKILNDISSFLKSKNLKLNIQKTQISSNEETLTFLGYNMTRESVLPRENILKNFFKKVESLDNPSLSAYKPWFFFEELFYQTELQTQSRAKYKYKKILELRYG